ncbi:MAG: hypothetical protein NZ455_14315 [Bacteroidia bacterium]|nr:hypothetical protein [Bacteroidia bacterium]MDW8345469.1 hypothetical protein [Bacteroidia bacterium]
MGGWGVAPLARSTPTRAQRRDTPKNKLTLLQLIPLHLHTINITLAYTS